MATREKEITDILTTMLMQNYNNLTKVRGMFNDQRKPVQEVKPGCAAEIIGWRALPSAGDEILQVKNEVCKERHLIL